jgi:copper chaperone CopZ
MSVNAELNVEDMSCSDRTAEVKKRLTALDGVEDVRIDQAAQKVTVKYDDIKINLVDIKQTLMEKGYSVIEI